MSGAVAAGDSPKGRGHVPPGKLAGWTLLVLVLVAVAYAANLAGGPPDRNVLYRYSTAVGAAVQYAIMLAIVAAIARGLGRETLGFRRPASWRRAAVLLGVSLGAIWAAGWVLNLFLDAGGEQGLVPTGWDPSRAGAFAANFAVVAVVAPVVEETTYRGLGFAAVRAYGGPLVAIAGTGLAFGLSHGLVVALPVLSLFGAVLAWLRWKTESLYPPIVLHAIFNATALTAAVTLGSGP